MMKKKVFSQLLILSFAFAALFIAGNNTFGNVLIKETKGEDCTSSTRCNGGFGDGTGTGGAIYCCQSARITGYADKDGIR